MGGCAAAMNGFRVGMDYCKSHEKAALVCFVELSSVHTTFDDNVNDAILHAIFGDGCAAAVLAGKTAKTAPKGAFAIIDDHACLMEGTEHGIGMEDMDFWAVHPGGRRIIEEAQNGLGLTEE